MDTRRGLEPKCVPQLFLGLLLGTRRSGSTWCKTHMNSSEQWLGTFWAVLHQVVQRRSVLSLSLVEDFTPPSFPLVRISDKEAQAM